MHLADLTGYVATQEKVMATYRERSAWAAMAIHNVARSGKFLERPNDCRICNGYLGGQAVSRAMSGGPADDIPAGVLRLFAEGFRAADIAEPLASFDAETAADLVARHMDDKGFDIVGVRRDGLVAGFVEREQLSAGQCGTAIKEFSEELPDAAPLLDVVRVLADGPRVFVSMFGRVAGIVTRDDMQKPAVRMWLFGMVTMVELRYTRLIEEMCPDETWRQYLSEGRLKKAADFMAERRRRNRPAELLDCLQLSDKGQIVARDERLRNRTVFASRRQVEEAIGRLEGLRNNLAHAQDIVSCDWDAIVQLSAHLDRLLEGAPAPP